MAGYTPLFNSITTSSIWLEDSDTRIVWITMLAMAGANGIVEGSIPGLAHIANVSVEACEKALNLFLSPDKYSRTQDYEGRRIKPVEGGWLILNHKEYRQRAKSRAEYLREWREAKERKERKETKERKERKGDNNNNNNNNNNKLQTQTVIHSETHMKHSETHMKHIDTVSLNELFEEFWQEYPRKIGKGAARKAFDKIKPSVDLVGKMIAAVRRQKTTPQWRKDGGQFIPYPATWLNQERWLDDTDPPPSEGAVPPPCVGPDGLTPLERFRKTGEAKL